VFFYLFIVVLVVISRMIANWVLFITRDEEEIGDAAEYFTKQYIKETKFYNSSFVTLKVFYVVIVNFEFKLKLQVSLVIHGRNVPSIWTANLEFVNKKSIFDWKIVIFLNVNKRIRR
jgi:hypothetical protein